MKQFTYSLIVFFSLAITALHAQPLDLSIVEVSGIVITRNEQGRITYVPFATVSVKNKQRGTYANYEGMFSIVVKKGETLTFSAVGFGEFSFTVPVDYPKIEYSLVVELHPKDLNIDEVIVFPWPDRNNFRAEFLAMQPTQALQMEDIAKNNLNRKHMMAIAGAMEMDGAENASMYLQQQASDFSYRGQMRPMPILSPLAWAQFFQQWQNKKKKKDEDE